MQEIKALQAQRTHELASALADGELKGAEFTRAVGLLASSPDAHAHWHGYQLIGDVLREGAGAAVGAHDPAFMVRLRQRLQQESALPQSREVLRVAAHRPSANDSVWRWKLVAGLCSLAVVGMLGWQLTAAPPQAIEMAASGPVPAPSQPPLAQADAGAAVMIRDPRLDQLIADHQQFGGTSALQMPAGFLRNATFEHPSR